MRGDEVRPEQAVRTHSMIHLQ